MNTPKLNVLNEIREQFWALPLEDRDALRPALLEAKEEALEEWRRMDAECRTAIAGAPLEEHYVDGRIISQSRFVRGIGGSARYLSPGEPGYADAAERIAAKKAIDTLVAEAAYQIWRAKRPCSVRIDYYGTKARVTDGTRVAIVCLNSL